MASFISKLLRRRKCSPNLRRARIENLDEEDDGFVMFEVDGKLFFGGRRSPNRRFLAGAADAYQDSAQVQPGRVAVLDCQEDDLQVWEMKRPHYPKVSDDGLVVVEDWLSWDGPLAGEVSAYMFPGDSLWTLRFQANVYGTQLSADGRHLLISTCNSDYAPHSGKTWMIDSHTGEHRWEHDSSGSILFVDNTPMIGVHGDRMNANNQFFPLGSDGAAPAEYYSVLDETEERDYCTNVWWVLGKLDEALKEGASDDVFKRYVAYLEAIKDGPDMDDHARARRYRMFGKLAERSGALREAYDYWSQALKLDSKVGIKRRHAALGNQLAKTLEN